MTFRVLCVITLCICLGQICAGSDEWINELKKSIRYDVYDVSEQFIDDIVKIAEKYRYNDLIGYIFQQTMALIAHRIPIEKNSTIDVSQVKDYHLKSVPSSTEEKILFDNLRISQLILSKQMPPERYNGIINLLFVCSFDCASTEEIKKALNYLYGIDTEATKTSFLDSHNLSKPTGEDDCPRPLRISPTIDALSHSVDIKQKVIQDFLAVREQFPCNRFAVEPLQHFVDIIQLLDGNVRKITACMIKERLGNFHVDSKRAKHYMESSESVLSARLPDETFRGIINFEKATIPDTPIDEIEKALEYLYDEVPKSNCSTTQNMTLQTE